MATEDSTCSKDIEHQTSSADPDAGIENESSVITNDQIGFSENQGMSKSDSNICNKGIKDCTSSADSKVGTKSYDLSDILECAVCLDIMSPPIYQCPNGHIICLTCKKHVRNRCPTCRHDIGDIRCLALEKVAASAELPCRYKIFGCEETFTSDKRLSHENICKFGPYSCPYTGVDCDVSGNIGFLIAHLKREHDIEMHHESIFTHKYVKSNPRRAENVKWAPTVFNCLGRQFCLHFEGTEPFYMCFLRFMGSQEEAEDFRYSLKLEGYGRKLKWQGVPMSLHYSESQIRDSGDGLIISRNMALVFSEGDETQLKLKVCGKIWKWKEN